MTQANRDLAIEVKTYLDSRYEGLNQFNGKVNFTPQQMEFILYLTDTIDTVEDMIVKDNGGKDTNG